MVHDQTALARAEQASQVLFGGEISGLSAVEIADIFADVPSAAIAKGKLQGEGIPLADLLVECGVATSKGEARRAIEGGGVYFNNQRVSDTAFRANLGHCIDGRFLVLRKGRRSYWLVNVSE